ncbi:MAG: glutathione S-transferase family protein [Granulosicoccus sp.]
MSLQLLTFGPAFGEPDASPFCVKAICLLNMAGVEWDLIPDSDSRKAPIGKLPVLIDGKRTIHDSDNIRYYLEKHYAADFDSGLSMTQKALSRALIRMIEEHLYFCQVYDRWVDDTCWAHVRDRFFSGLPPVMRTIVPKLVRRNVLSALHGQGVGRLAYDDMFARAALDIAAIETLLDDDQYLFGAEPTAADVSVGCTLASMSANPERTRLSARVLDSKRLMSYITDLKSAIYPEQSQTPGRIE